jgi:hypothetical protein
VILPNNKNILLAAKQAVELSRGKQVAVVPTTTIPQGIAALFALDPYGEFDTVISAMERAGALIETGEITTATRNVTMDGLQVKKGNIIGLHNDILCVAGTDLADVVVNLLNEMGCSSKELVTLYYGVDVRHGDAESLVKYLRGIFPEQDFQLQSGGQSHYYYIMSVE